MLESSLTFMHKMFHNQHDQSVLETKQPVSSNKEINPSETVFTFWMEEMSSISLITPEHSRAAPVKKQLYQLRYTRYIQKSHKNSRLGSLIEYILTHITVLSV